jgi:hypothetical protein
LFLCSIKRRTDPPSRPTSDPPLRAAAVKGGRQAGALPRLALDGRKLGGIPFGVGTALQSLAE